MKSSSEYRALAWKELRKHFKESLLYSFLILLFGGVILYLTAIGSVLCSYESSAEKAVGVGVDIVSTICIGILYYCIPIWYISLLRHAPAHRLSSDGWGRVIGCSLLLVVPSFIQEGVNQLKAKLNLPFAGGTYSSSPGLDGLYMSSSTYNITTPYVLDFE